MDKPKYQYKSERKLRHFEFISEGPKGLIHKMVEYTETKQENVFNLAFGDYDKTSGSIDDLSITNNGDSLKVLATVASTIYAFIKQYPESWIFATGSTSARTRLYRMGITNNIAAIQSDFMVFGLRAKGNEWEEFVAGEDYDAFLITKKENYENQN